MCFFSIRLMISWTTFTKCSYESPYPIFPYWMNEWTNAQYTVFKLSSLREKKKIYRFSTCQIKEWKWKNLYLIISFRKYLWNEKHFLLSDFVNRLNTLQTKNKINKQNFLFLHSKFSENCWFMRWQYI